MRSTKWAVLLAVLVVSSLLLTACPSAQQTPEVIRETVVVTSAPEVVKETVVVEQTVQVVATATAVPATKKFRWVSGSSDIPTLDPALVSDTQSNTILQQMFIPLAHNRTPDWAAEPGMATWTTSDDGKTFTFKVRNDVPWVRYNVNTGNVEKVQDENGNDRMVTAKDFEYGILRLLDPATASSYAYVWADIVEGAGDYNSGKITDTTKVGVKAVDDTTLVITITKPASFFPGIMAITNASAQPKWQIDEKGDRWTEGGNSQSYGPYALKEWVHDSRISLVLNPFWPGGLEGVTDLGPAKIPELEGTIGLDQTAEFALYETGDIDYSTAPLQELDRIKSDATLSKELYIGFAGATYYYGFNVTKPPVDDVHCRLALSYAVDRQAIVDNVTKGGQIPAQWFARPGLTAAPTLEQYPDLGVKYDPAMAKAEFDQCKYKDNWPSTILAMNQVEGHIKIGQAIQQMWKDTLGIDVEIQTQEWGVYLDTLQNDPPQIWRLGWSLDYADANNFDYDVFYSTSSNNNTRWKSAEFDKLVSDAAVETDVTKRTEMYAQAEEILVKTDAAIIPIYWYTSVNLTKPYVTRTYEAGSPYFYMWDVAAR